MNRGGVETWLMHVLRSIDPERFRFDFLVHTSEESAFDDEIRRLGSRIHHCTSPRNPVRYAREFKSILRDYGPYDVVHSHVYLYSGFTLRLAAEVGVPIRIAHSHTAITQKRFDLARLTYERLMRAWVTRYATDRIGISRVSADGLFGQQARDTAMVLHYGFDFSPFLQPQDPAQIKAELGIVRDRKVVGHVGRFLAVKNHAFIVEGFRFGAPGKVKREERDARREEEAARVSAAAGV